jgi:5-methylcytosine-specific restriction protein A
MATFLLTWKPTRWQWTSQQEDIATLNRNGKLPFRGSCGNTRSIAEDDRVFLLKQGKVSPGLVASGWAKSAPFKAPHWEDQQGDHSPDAWYVNIEFDVLSAEPLIDRERLNHEPFNEVHWDTMSSGISIDPEVGRALERLWGIITGSHFEPAPDEVDDRTLPEGATTLVAVNAFERNARARERCIAHYGTRCQVCGVDLADRYGEAASGLIHVHHIVPLATIRKRYRVHPVNDLRPVCPNCHAVIHRTEPPYALEEVRGFLRASHPRG